LALSACSVLQAPPRALVYDFGPVAAVAAKPSAVRAVVVLPEVEAIAALDSTALLYRLNYSDAQQLRPYAQARWSMTPAQLLRQRLRESLGRERVVVGVNEGVLAGRDAWSLRLSLEEFSQVFESADQSQALVRVRATLSHPAGGGERLQAQRSFVGQKSSGTADAAGGVRALAQATDAVIAEIQTWLDEEAGAPRPGFHEKQPADKPSVDRPPIVKQP
jgi:cholesterol transport system auxiliary component